MLTWHNRWTVHKGYSTEKMDVVYSLKASSAFQFRTKLDVYLATNTSEETVSDYRIKASSWDLSCSVYKGDNIVAEVRTNSRKKKKTIYTYIYIYRLLLTLEKKCLFS